MGRVSPAQLGRVSMGGRLIIQWFQQANSLSRFNRTRYKNNENTMILLTRWTRAHAYSYASAHLYMCWYTNLASDIHGPPYTHPQGGGGGTWEVPSYMDHISLYMEITGSYMVHIWSYMVHIWSYMVHMWSYMHHKWSYIVRVRPHEVLCLT